MKIKKGRIILLIILALLSTIVYYGVQSAKIATAYVAKIACSCTMVSNRSIESVYKEDLSKYSFIKSEVDLKDSSVTSSFLGVISKKAIFRKGLGCTLVNGFSEEEIRNQMNAADILPSNYKASDPWPLGDSLTEGTLPEEIDSIKLIKAVNKAFEESDTVNPKRTRAVIVVYKGNIIAEKYGPGISSKTPLLGWSMTKSITNALVGILVKQGKVKIENRAPIDEWKNDKRSKITLDQMMRMSSGLEFKEVYNVVADATKMLFLSPSAAEIPINKPLENDPDTEWSYSSGTTNIISLIIKKSLKGSQADYFNFPKKVLFNKISMSTAIMEPDPSGTFVGSSFMYAVARDWARFGILYLNDGIWNDERILPEGWVKYSSTPTPKAPQGQYGAHFWLNAGENPEGKNRKWKNLPKDMYYASGFEGQNVAILPSDSLIVVRLGNTQKRDNWDVGVLIEDILGAFKK